MARPAVQSKRRATPQPAVDSALLADCNREQRRAITHASGPLLIVAGAGTGKTTVLTRRIAWLILEQGVPTDGILALTFTEKAATEVEERIDRLLPYGYVDLWVSTFHGFCNRILKAHAFDIGLPNDFRLLDTTGTWLLLRAHLDELSLDYYRPRGNPTKFLHALLQHFSRCKDEAITPEEYLAYAKELALNADAEHQDTRTRGHEHTESRVSSSSPVLASAPSDAARVAEVANAYHAYEQLLLNEGCLDFGDLLLHTLRLFLERPRILERYRRQFAHVLVDEFQDTNWAQYEIVKLIANPRNNLTVVGDDDQSIYRWRGASMSNILHFKEDFPNAAQVAITTNYRSRQGILDASYQLITANNPARLEVTLGVEKKLRAAKEGKATIEVLHAQDAAEEVRMVVERMIALKNGVRHQSGSSPSSSARVLRANDVSWNDFAILVRANRQADQFLPALQAAGIPYQFFASRGLYRKPIILDILAYVKLLDDYHESTACYRVCTMPVLGWSPDEVTTLLGWANRKSKSLFVTLQTANTIPDIRPETVARASALVAMVAKHAELARRAPVREVILAFLNETGLLHALTREEDAEDHETVQVLNQFWKKVEAFEEAMPEPTVRQFIAAMNLERESGEEGALPADPDAGPEAVRVLTVHAAKGLEFRYVFVVNMVEQRFPAVGRADPIELPIALTKVIVPEGDVHLQEERRLCYVAATRAKYGLWFTYATDYGGTRKRKPSRFLAELGVAVDGGESKVDSARLCAAPRSTNNDQRATPRAPAHAIPSKLSYTQLRSYQTCPWQYHYAHVLRIPIRGRYQLSFGSTMHLTLERFFRMVLERRGSTQGSLLADAAPAARAIPSLDELLKLYEAAWIDDWYESAQQQRTYFENGKRILREFYAKHERKGWPNVTSTEQPFVAKFGVYRVKGKIDRIDAVDGGVGIVDYKTGAAKQALSKDDTQQLLIYQMAATQVLGMQPMMLSYYYLETNEQQTFLGSSEDIAKLEETVAHVGAQIANGEFAPTPGQWCTFCDFRDICESAQR